MSISLSGLASLYELLYTDRMDITPVVEDMDDDGATVNGYPQTPQQKDVHCRISFSSQDTPKGKEELYNKVKMNPVIFCSVDVNVKPGDKIVVRRLRSDGLVYESYSGMLAISGRPNKYETHQQFELSMEGEA